MIVIHRINTIQKLKRVPEKYGVEIDVRAVYDTLYLSHDPLTENKDYITLEKFCEAFNHAFLIINTKVAGYEQNIQSILSKYNIDKYFFLDVEFPFIYKSLKEGFNKIAIRYSEKEAIENCALNNSEWIWIDTNTMLPVTAREVPILRAKKTCLVCPERWGRPQDINKYISMLNTLGFKLDGVMTSMNHAQQWEDSGVLND